MTPALLALALAPARAVELEGYAEARFQYTGGVDGTAWALTERLRPSIDADISESVRMHMTVEAALGQGRWDEHEAFAAVQDFYGGFAHLFPDDCDLASPPQRYETISDVLSLERLYVDVYRPGFDLRLGRQPLNWGSALSLNPTDLFAEVLVAEPWRERKGVNAAKLTVPFGDRNQVVAVAALNDTFNQARFGLKPTLAIPAIETDVALVASATSTWDRLGLYADPGTEVEVSVKDPFDDPFVGVDVKGQFHVGWWIEGGLHLDPDAAVEVDETEGWAAIPEVSVGLDYSLLLLDSFLVGAQYTYDGTGIDDVDDYNVSYRGGSSGLNDYLDAFCDELITELELQEDPLPDDVRFTQGQHYAVAYARIGAFDDFLFQLSDVTNLQDRSTILVPDLRYAPGSRFSINVGAQVLLGQGEFQPDSRQSEAYVGSITGLGPQFIQLGGLVPKWAAYSYVRWAL